MTRIALVTVLALLGASSVASAALVQEAQRPLLGVADTRPFVVQGTGFERGERVNVLLALNGRQYWQRAVATREGSFRVTFDVALGRCARYTVRAHGALGSRAALLRFRALPNCQPPAASTT